MIQASCHCGAVVLDIAEPPKEVTDCNCSLCRRYGTLWAYYPLRHVRVRPGAVTDEYMWGERSTVFHRCPTCGCVTHWSAIDPARDETGVNARLLPAAVLAQARVRHLDGADTFEYSD